MSPIPTEMQNGWTVGSRRTDASSNPTARVTSTNRPEQALVDWVLRETGYEVWHSNVVSMLSADARTLKVYHTPEVQAIVGDVVDRIEQLVRARVA